MVVLELLPHRASASDSDPCSRGMNRPVERVTARGSLPEDQRLLRRSHLNTLPRVSGLPTTRTARAVTESSGAEEAPWHWGDRSDLSSHAASDHGAS
jgi:hypothetical protein